MFSALHRLISRSSLKQGFCCLQQHLSLANFLTSSDDDNKLCGIWYHTVRYSVKLVQDELVGGQAHGTFNAGLIKYSNFAQTRVQALVILQFSHPLLQYAGSTSIWQGLRGASVNLSLTYAEARRVMIVHYSPL